MATSFGGTDPTAVVGRRFVAAVVDWLLWVGVGAVLFLVLHDTYPSYGVITCSDVPQPNVCVGADTLYVVEGGKAWLMYGISWAFALAVYVVLRGLTGRTPGTALLGLAVVDGQGRPAGVPKALLRSVAGVVDYVPCCLPLVGMVTIGTTQGHRRVGDMAASTYCVDRSYVGRQIRVDPSPGSPVGAYGVAAPPVYGAPAQPQWDPQRGAYVQWDHASGRWLRFDQATNQWVPLDEG